MARSATNRDATTLNASQAEIPCGPWALTRLSDSDLEGTSSGGNSFQPELSNNFTSSNIGFKLLKKAGWREGSGLGIAEQGRLYPLEANVKYDKRGIGAEKVAKRKIHATLKQTCESHSEGKPKIVNKRRESLTKKARKALANEKQMQEQTFQSEFFREFWPENV